MHRPRFLRSEIIVVCIAAILAIMATVARAVEDIDLTIDALGGADWHAQGLRVHLGLLMRGPQAQLSIDTLRIGQISQPIRDVRIECASVEISTSRFACTDASVAAHVPGLGVQQFRADLIYGREDASIRFAVRGIQVEAGRLDLSGQLREEGWNLNAQSQRIPMAALIKLASRFDVAMPVSVASGAATVDLEAWGAGAQIASITAKGELIEVTANNESGSIASDRLTLGFNLGARRQRGQWLYDAKLNAAAGQGYFEPIFLDFDARALAATARGSYSEVGILVADSFRVEHTHVLTASGRGVLDTQQSQPVRDLQLQLAELQFPGAYESYLQPLLLDTNFKALRTSGSISGEILVNNGAAERIDISLADIAVEGGDVSVHGLGGDLHWQQVEEDREQGDRTSASISELRWTGGELYDLEFGASTIKFTTQERNVRLIEPARIPLLDGALQLDSLRVRNAGLPTVAFIIDATIEPISVRRLCHAFGWPEFGGRLGGTISKLRMREGVITLGTTLEASVFEGLVRVSDLRLEEPFGKWPRFYSSVGLQDLDLELVTGAFSFGRITGRLSGAIDGLELFNWSPIAFNARLFTPPNDRSRHRISQRAVENIGSIGGGGAGVTAALSSGFLRFFEDFNYARLGISCRLRNEVCEMNGVAPAPNGGYYLVEGRGLPRIDVIGNSRRVDWPRLVQQLIAATESGGPVVE